jgi:hypothetical protein
VYVTRRLEPLHTPRRIGWRDKLFLGLDVAAGRISRVLKKPYFSKTTIKIIDVFA